MKNIVVASQNPIKLKAVENGFARMFQDESFQLEAISVASGVSEQPVGDEETILGAHNRARNAAKSIPGADYWVGVEGGVDDTGEEMTAFAWVVVITKNQVGRGRTGTFYLPPQVAMLVRDGKELGEADDIVFGRTNSKQSSGAVGLLTDDVVDRSILYEQAVILALIPFKNPGLYAES